MNYCKEKAENAKDGKENGVIEKDESMKKNKKTMEKDERKKNKVGRWAMRKRGKRERKNKECCASGVVRASSSSECRQSVALRVGPRQFFSEAKSLKPNTGPCGI